MLPPRHRLRSGGDFATAVRGPRSGGRLIVLHATRTDVRAGQPPRVGFVVSKAVGTAVVRNRVKRRLRALVASRLDLVPPGVDVVVRARPDSAGATSGQLGVELDRGLRAVRVELLGGHHGAAAQRTAALGEHLAAVAAVLAEMACGLAEVGEDEGPGGIA